MFHGLLRLVSVKNLSSISKNRHQLTRTFHPNLEGLAESDTGPYQLVNRRTHFTRLEPTMFINLKDTVSSSLKHYANQLHPCVSTSITWQSSIRISKTLTPFVMSAFQNKYE